MRPQFSEANLLKPEQKKPGLYGSAASQPETLQSAGKPSFLFGLRLSIDGEFWKNRTFTGLPIEQKYSNRCCRSVTITCDS